MFKIYTNTLLNFLQHGLVQAWNEIASHFLPVQGKEAHKGKEQHHPSRHQMEMSDLDHVPADLPLVKNPR
jgi:hypothetical protein